MAAQRGKDIPCGVAHNGNCSEWASQAVPAVKNPPTNAGDTETWVRSLDQDDTMEEETTTHSSILAWRTPRTEEPGGLQSIGWQRVGHT